MTVCSYWGYRQAWVALNSLADAGPSLAFAVTNDSVSAATSRVLRASGVLAPCDRTKMLCDQLSVRKAHFAGRAFTELDIFSDEGGETVDIGSVNGRTLLMFRSDYFDPSIDLIQGSLFMSPP
jgi:hypothetical protein